MTSIILKLNLTDEQIKLINSNVNSNIIINSVTIASNITANGKSNAFYKGQY